MKSWKKIQSLDLIAEQKRGLVGGAYCGFEALDPLYSVKIGCTSYIYGSPYHGKTELWFEILMNLSEIHGMRHVLWTPETGTAEQVAAELIRKRIRADFYKAKQNIIFEAQNWLDEHFIIIDEDGETFTLDEFYALVDEVEAKTGKIHTTTVDPWNEFYHSFHDYSGREDKYLEVKLGWVRLNARAKMRHNCIITHVRDQEKREREGISFYPAATPREIAGGQAWFRKGEAMMCVWRPPFIEGEYQKNEAKILVHKAKPKGIGNTGECSLYYDPERYRYYELIDGAKRYAGKKPLSYMQDDMPF